MSDLEYTDSYGEDPDLNVDAVFRPGIDTPFSPSTFHDFEMGSMAQNSILIDEEQYKENFPPLQSTPVSERPTQPPVLLRSHLFGTRIEKIPENF